MRIKHFNQIALIDDRNWERHVRSVREIPLAVTAEGRRCFLNPNTHFIVKEKHSTINGTVRPTLALD